MNARAGMALWLISAVFAGVLGFRASPGLSRSYLWPNQLMGSCR